MIKKEVEKMKKNYKLQITKKMAHELHELPRIGAISNKKFLRGVQGGSIFQKEPPWPPEAKEKFNE